MPRSPWNSHYRMPKAGPTTGLRCRSPVSRGLALGDDAERRREISDMTLMKTVLG